MLVLARREGECILIGDDIVVSICSIRGDKVQIGITAPPTVVIDREEVAERVKLEGRRNKR